MCTAFSTWQRISDKIRCLLTVAAEKWRAAAHLEFSTQLCREHLTNGRYFPHEHSAYATSWQVPVTQKTMNEPGVETATHDQCQYGCADAHGLPVKKPTMFITNALELGKRFGPRCI